MMIVLLICEILEHYLLTYSDVQYVAVEICCPVFTKCQNVTLCQWKEGPQQGLCCIHLLVKVTLHLIVLPGFAE